MPTDRSAGRVLAFAFGAAALFDITGAVIYRALRSQLPDAGHVSTEGPFQHATRTIQEPSAEQAVLLREKAPELYDLWLRIAQDKAETDNYVHARAVRGAGTARWHSGRPRALGAMIVVLGVLWLSGLGERRGVYVGGVIAIVDLLIMLVLFFGLRPEHLTETGRARKRRLSRLRAR